MTRTWPLWPRAAGLALALCPASVAAQPAERDVALLIEMRTIPIAGDAALAIGGRAEASARAFGPLVAAAEISLAAALADTAPGESELLGAAARAGATIRLPVIRSMLDSDFGVGMWLEAGAGAEWLPDDAVRPDGVLGFAADLGGDDIQFWWGWRVHAAPAVGDRGPRPIAVAARQRDERAAFDLGYSSVFGVRWR